MFERSADIYDAVYAAKGKDYAAEADAIRAAIAARGGPASGRLLDVGCGTGEHLRHFAAHFAVAGLDRSPGMLAVARAKLPGVALHEGDMTGFDLGDRFDVVTCLFAAIGYLPDEAALGGAIAAMARHLAPGGRLAIEPALTPDRVGPARTSVLDAVAGGRRVHRVTSAAHEDGVLRITFDYDVDGREHFRETHPIRLFPREAYERAFRAAGLAWTHDPVGPAGTGLFVASGQGAAAPSSSRT